jgi:hypothetical protein
MRRPEEGGTQRLMQSIRYHQSLRNEAVYFTADKRDKRTLIDCGGGVAKLKIGFDCTRLKVHRYDLSNEDRSNPISVAVSNNTNSQRLTSRSHYEKVFGTGSFTDNLMTWSVDCKRRKEYPGVPFRVNGIASSSQSRVYSACMYFVRSWAKS